MDSFLMVHRDGKVLVEVIIGETTYIKDITSYLEEHNAVDEWLDYKLGL